MVACPQAFLDLKYEKMIGVTVKQLPLLWQTSGLFDKQFRNVFGIRCIQFILSLGNICAESLKMFWGFSESLDMQKEYASHLPPNADQPEELNIVLLGGGDARHILKSLAKSFNHRTKLNFYVVEGCLELLARNLLLLSLALEAPDQISLRGKTHMFMDIFGNALLRASSCSYMCSKANHFLRCITDLEYARTAMPTFHFDRLRFAERDDLESVFQFWRNRAEHKFDISAYWNQRLRHEMGARFDSRKGAFDWDLQMRLKDYGAQQICPQEYMHWRDTGIAFVFPEYEHNSPNKSLAAGIQKNGGQFKHRGYVGDISVGPFCSFGITSEDATMHKAQHGTNEFRATDVTERNVQQLMYEIQERQSYTFDRADVHKYGSTQLLMPKAMPAQQSNVNESELRQYNQPLLATPNISVTFCSMDDVLGLTRKPEFSGFFHVIFVAQTYFKLISRDIANVFAEQAVLLIETKQISVMRKDDIAKHLKEIRNFAKDLNLTSTTNFHINLPIPIARFRNWWLN